MERAEPIRKLLRHLGRVADICPAIAEGGISSEADIIRRPPFIQCIQPCEMLILGQAYLPVLARKVGDIPFSTEIVLHIVGCAAEVYRLPHIGTVDIVAGRLAAFLIQPYRTGGGFTGAFLYSSLAINFDDFVMIPISPKITGKFGIIWKKGIFMPEHLLKFINFCQKYDVTPHWPKF